MSQNPVEFENHLQERVMEIQFPQGYTLHSAAAMDALKQAWVQNLKSWHSPYTCLFQLKDVHIAEEQVEAFGQLIKFFKNFFMKKIVGWTEEPYVGPTLPFEIFTGYEAAAQQTGLSRTGSGPKRDLSDLRSRIQMENDFHAHVIEVNFLAETELATPEDVAVLQSKLKNNLMQWHTPYSVLFNCLQVSFTPEAKAAFAQTEKFLKQFFCKAIVGYMPRAPKETYPFQTFRVRHQAVAQLEHSGLLKGDQANCASRKG